MKTLTFTLIIVLFFTQWVNAADPFTINLNNTSQIQYCADSVLIAKDLTIGGAPNIQGMKISFIQGFVWGEDELIYSGKLTTNTTTPGTLILTGSTIVQDYVDAIRSIKYKNIKSVPTLGIRKIMISLNDVDYLPSTGHFYRYVSSAGISWSAAKNHASTTLYYGLRGYLATITSQEENDFIKAKTKGVGWIGASDVSKEGDWRWVTGPEGLDANGLGRLFWIGTGLDFTTGVPGKGPVLGQYNNWNDGEPNNSGGSENFAHILFFPNDPVHSLRWNDLPNGGGNGEYSSQGYLIEWGGYKDDPVVNLIATLELVVNSIILKTETIPGICQGESVTLNQPDAYSNPAATYLWSPTGNFPGSTTSNPKVTPALSTTYTVKAKRGSCEVNRDFVVKVNPKPIVKFDIDPNTCYGFSVAVNYLGGEDPTRLNFTWIFGGDTIKNGINIPKDTIPLGTSQQPRNVTLKITDQNGCTDQLASNNLRLVPNLSSWTVTDPMVCLSDSFEFAVTIPDPSVLYKWNFGDGKSATGPEIYHKYQLPGKYDIQLTVTNPVNTCFNSAKIKDMVTAEPLPVAAFTMSDSIVYKDKPDVVFTNTSTTASPGEIKGWEWNFGDYGFSDEFSPEYTYKTTGRHRVLLAVSNDSGCKDSIVHTVLVAFGQIFVPNAFSPNAPDIKDRIFLPDTDGVMTAGYHLTILSRWDDIIYEVWHQKTPWDGKMDNGAFAPPGVYIWRLLYNDVLERTHRQTGTVMLIY